MALEDLKSIFGKTFDGSNSPRIKPTPLIPQTPYVSGRSIHEHPQDRTQHIQHHSGFDDINKLTFNPKKKTPIINKLAGKSGKVTPLIDTSFNLNKSIHINAGGEHFTKHSRLDFISKPIPVFGGGLHNQDLPILDTTYFPLAYPDTNFDMNATPDGESMPPGNYSGVTIPSEYYGDSPMVPGQTPILDTALRQPPSFMHGTLSGDWIVSEDLDYLDGFGHPYLLETFDPRIPKNTGIQITNKNPYISTRNKAVPFSGATFATAGVDGGQSMMHTTFVGKDLGASGGYRSLYNPNHTPFNETQTNYLILTDPQNPFSPYEYGGNVNRNTLKIGYQIGEVQHYGWQRDSNIEKIGTSGGVNLAGAVAQNQTHEPYIVSAIPSNQDNITNYDYRLAPPLGLDGRSINAANRSFPIVRALTDGLRVGKFLTSSHGIAHMFATNVYGLVPNTVVRAKRTDTTKTDPDITNSDDILELKAQRHNEFNNPLTTLMATAGRLLGTTPNLLFKKHLFELSNYEKDLLDGNLGMKGANYALENSFRGDTSKLKGLGDSKFALFGGKEIKKLISGDKMTMIPLHKGVGLKVMGDTLNYMNRSLTKLTETDENILKKKWGMPMYFRDLRDNAYIFFRAYLEGLTETVTPSWTPTNYVGRSEPVYIYERAERDVSFTLKVAAQTAKELTMIYKKLNRLTSLCYPQYADDSMIGNSRMKPPLTKFRLGELYGKTNHEMLGFIQSLNYVFPEESTWETEAGYRVPKFINVTIEYKVIHGSVPALNNVNSSTKSATPDTAFFGINDAS